LHGEVGETLLASELEKQLADAVEKKATVVVLDIDSPGGSVDEAQKVIGVIHAYNKQARIVALIGQDFSAAAILTLSCKEIYVRAVAVIGAATSFIPSNQAGGERVLSPKLEEKMQSAWRAMARNSAEEGGHEPLLAEAMIDNKMELLLEQVNGKPVVREYVDGPRFGGERTLCRKGQILTLSSREAVECGLARALVDDYAELGKTIGLSDWKPCATLSPIAQAAGPAARPGVAPTTRPKSFDGIEYPPLTVVPVKTKIPLHSTLEDVSKMLQHDPATLGIRIFNSDKSEKIKNLRLSYAISSDSSIVTRDGAGGTATEVTHNSHKIRGSMLSEWFTFNIGEADLAGLELKDGTITEICLFYKNAAAAEKALQTAKDPKDWFVTRENGTVTLTTMAAGQQRGTPGQGSTRMAIEQYLRKGNMQRHGSVMRANGSLFEEWESPDGTTKISILYVNGVCVDWEVLTTGDTRP